MVWKSENPNTFSKVMAIRSTRGQLPVRAHRHPERVGQPADLLERSRPPRTARCRPPCWCAPAPTARTSSASSRSTTARTGSRSATTTHSAPFTGALKIGPVAFRGGSGGGTASFDFFRVMSGSDPNTPVECSTGCSPQSDQFNGTALDPKWQVVNPVAGNAADRGQRPSDDADAAGRPVRRTSATRRRCCRPSPSGSWVATAKVAHATINRRRRGGRPGADQPAQPEPPAQDDGAVQGRHRSEHRRQPAGQVGGARADVQQRVGRRCRRRRCRGPTPAR